MLGNRSSHAPPYPRSRCASTFSLQSVVNMCNASPKSFIYSTTHTAAMSSSLLAPTLFIALCAKLLFTRIKLCLIEFNTLEKDEARRTSSVCILYSFALPLFIILITWIGMAIPSSLVVMVVHMQYYCWRRVALFFGRGWCTCLDEFSIIEAAIDVPVETVVTLGSPSIHSPMPESLGI